MCDRLILIILILKNSITSNRQNFIDKKLRTVANRPLRVNPESTNSIERVGSWGACEQSGNDHPHDQHIFDII